jgi:hypothetical protein
LLITTKNKQGDNMAFKSGVSGNPNGRPKGSGYRQNIFNKLVVPHSDDLINKAIAMAKDGDSHMLKFFIERLIPAKPIDEPISLGLEADMKLESALSMGKRVLQLLDAQEITPAEAKKIFGVVKYYQENIAAYELLESYKELKLHLNK